MGCGVERPEVVVPCVRPPDDRSSGGSGETACVCRREGSVRIESVEGTLELGCDVVMSRWCHDWLPICQWCQRIKGLPGCQGCQPKIAVGLGCGGLHM